MKKVMHDTIRRQSGTEGGKDKKKLSREQKRKTENRHGEKIGEEETYAGYTRRKWRKTGSEGEDEATQGTPYPIHARGTPTMIIISQGGRHNTGGTYIDLGLNSSQGIYGAKKKSGK